MDSTAEIQHWVAIAKEVEIHKGGRGNPQALRDWYNDGADGQIDWGNEGDMADCIAIAGKYLDNPEGFCQLRHIDATGEPAGKADGEITKGLDESIADVLRHDLAHDNWHRMHGDEPCKSEADCARLRANYSENKPIEVEKSDITIGKSEADDNYDAEQLEANLRSISTEEDKGNHIKADRYKLAAAYHFLRLLNNGEDVQKGDTPGHEFHGNQYSQHAREHFRARRSHKVSESQARQSGNFKAARLHGQAMAAHKTAEILAERNSPDYPKSRQRAQEATAKANLAHAVGKIRKDAAPLDPYNQQAESLVKEAEAETNKALALQKRGQYESAQYAHASAAELYRQAAEIEDDGNADVLDDLAKEADDAAKYCEFFYSQGGNHSPAEIVKATGKVPPFRGRPTSDDTPDGSQDWGWLGEGDEVDDSSTDDSSTDDTSEAEDD